MLNRAVEEGDEGNVELVRSLLQSWHGAHDKYRMFPLVYDTTYPIGPMQIAVAFENDDTTILDLLLDAHIDPLKRTATGFLPIHAAANVGNPRSVRLLLEKGGCDPNLPDANDGYTALMMAADDTNGVAVVKVLLEMKQTNINQADHHGNTALHWAVFKGNLNIVQLLLSKRRELNIDAVNKWGNTAMHYAFYRGQHASPHQPALSLQWKRTILACAFASLSSLVHSVLTW
jgi:ankyrin repeat protein